MRLNLVNNMQNRHMKHIIRRDVMDQNFLKPESGNMIP